MDSPEAAYRKAIELRPDYIEAHIYLAQALYDQMKLVEAEAVCRQAIASKPQVAGGYWVLGKILWQRQKLEEAVEAFRKADQLLPNDPDIRQWLEFTERSLRLERKLDACLAGKEQPADPREASLLAYCAAKREDYRAALRFWSEAFKQEPALAEELEQHHRSNAACCACLLAAGKGKDAGSLTEKDRAALRRQALDWLRADLKAYSSLLDKGPKAQLTVQQQLANWQQEADLASVRGSAAINRLPEAEREPWRTFWADVDALLKRVQGK